MIAPSSLRQQLRLYLVLDPDVVPANPIETVQAAVTAGVTMVQLRAKNRSDREILELAKPLRELCGNASVPFIVNDRLDLALACNADGVHLGVDDLPQRAARSLGGQDFIIGYSPETDTQILNASRAGASYLGIGPVFATSSKRDAGAALGTIEFARRLRLSSLPCVGIGGIDATNARQIVIAGAAGIAVVSAILHAQDAASATAALLTAMDR